MVFSLLFSDGYDIKICGSVKWNDPIETRIYC